MKLELADAAHTFSQPTQSFAFPAIAALCCRVFSHLTVNSSDMRGHSSNHHALPILADQCFLGIDLLEVLADFLEQWTWHFHRGVRCRVTFYCHNQLSLMLP